MSDPMTENEKRAIDLAARLGAALSARSARLGWAESCTGGLVSRLTTAVPGASGWYVGAVVAYDNRVKSNLLGVPETTLAAHGAVSRETVEAMALGALTTLGANFAGAVSGIAGPSGGTPDKPVGAVWMAWASARGVKSAQYRFTGDRERVMATSAVVALEGMLRFVEGD